MCEVQVKSVCIDGDKTCFSSKGAIDRLKRDLKNKDNEKLSLNDYFKEGWTYQIISNENNEIKIKLVKKEIQVQQNQTNEKREMLKMRLKQMRMGRTSQSNLKMKFKDNVPKDLVDAYLELKKVKLPIEVPNPEEVLSKKQEFAPIIHTMVQSFNNFKGGNNPIINYYKLLATHLGLPTTVAQPQQNNQVNQQNPTNSFLEQLRQQKIQSEQNDINNEMNKIYESMGINIQDSNNLSDNDSDNEETIQMLKKMNINKDINL